MLMHQEDAWQKWVLTDLDRGVALSRKSFNFKNYFFKYIHVLYMYVYIYIYTLRYDT